MAGSPPPASPPPAQPTQPHRAFPKRANPVLHFGQGLMMGSADIVPGISGGTVALIVGIYERLIEAIRAVTTLPVVLLRERTMRAARVHLRQVEWGFVIPLGIGILTAIVVGARLIPPIMEAYPVESRALFFGLVAASLIIPWRRAGGVGTWGVAMAVIAGIVAFVLVGLPAPVTADPSLGRVFGSAAVAICAMILPGVSGAFLLKVLGIYEPTLRAVSGADIAYIAVFVLGAAVGISLFARLLSWLLTHYSARTMVVLVGLLAGSLRALWPWQGTVEMQGELVETPAILTGPPDLTGFLVAFVIAAVGFAFVAGLTWFGERKNRV